MVAALVAAMALAGVPAQAAEAAPAIWSRIWEWVAAVLPWEAVAERDSAPGRPADHGLSSAASEQSLSADPNGDD